MRCAVGLMSGTSCDAIDAALIWTDGEDSTILGPTAEVPIPPALRRRVRALQRRADRALVAGHAAHKDDARFLAQHALLSVAANGNPASELAQVECALTDLHAEAVRRVLAAAGARVTPSLIGFHGQTLCHWPPSRSKKYSHSTLLPFTWQLGDGQRLAQLCGVPVVFRFRDADVAAGGEGAPLAPAYHRALCRKLSGRGTVAILNIGGVSNLTVVAEDRMLACDVGPGNALLDDFMLRRTGTPCDLDGRTAASGQPDRDVVRAAMRRGTALGNFLRRRAPKSCDRDQFAPSLPTAALEALSTSDGAATLTLLTAACVKFALDREAVRPARLIVCGGGRLNPAMMGALRRELGPAVRVQSTDAPEFAGQWRGDSIEAEAFAYLAVRSQRGLPLSWRQTTGVSEPRTGGVLALPVAASGRWALLASAAATLIGISLVHMNKQ